MTLKIEKLPPSTERFIWKRPRCEQDCKYETIRYRLANEGTRCNFAANYNFNGKLFCIRHAQEAALAYLLTQGTTL